MQFNKSCSFDEFDSATCVFSVQLGRPHRSDRFSSALAQSGRRTTLILRVFVDRKIRATEGSGRMLHGTVSFNRDSASFYIILYNFMIIINATTSDCFSSAGSYFSFPSDANVRTWNFFSTADPITKEREKTMTQMRTPRM